MLVFVEGAAEPVPSADIEVRDLLKIGHRFGERAQVAREGRGRSLRIQTRQALEQTIEEDATWRLQSLQAGAVPPLAGVANGILAIDDPQEVWAEATPGLSPQILLSREPFAERSPHRPAVRPERSSLRLCLGGYGK